MSAIAGIYYRNHRPVDRTDLERMADRLAHRGRDGTGIWCEGSVGFIHQMLWTTPESLTEKLPYSTPKHHFVITADARIDNRAELCSHLGIVGTEQTQIADSQLILAAYQKWGDRCCEHLLGDFAFAIWDQTRQRLFCARDPFGVKPFYYYYSSECFAFATEIKALLCLPEIPCRLNPTRIGDYLAHFTQDKQITFYQDIVRLVPSHWLIVAPQTIQSQSYWSLDPKQELKLGSDQDYAEAFREIFIEAVRCRLRSAFPVGSHLSGGLDSSSITCIARQLLAQENKAPLHTFSATFETVPQCDERPFMQAVLEGGGVTAHFIAADQRSPLTQIEEMLWHQDQPFVVPNLFIFWEFYRVAQQAGVRVMLDGEDGDGTVSYGFSYLKELFIQMRWLKLLSELQQTSLGLKTSPLKLFWQFGLKPLIPQIWRHHWRTLSGQGFYTLHPGLNSSFARQIGIEDRVRAAYPTITLTARGSHYQGLIHGQKNWVLDIIENTAAAFDLELRHPYFDRRVVELCLAIPAHQKLAQGLPRILLRRAMADILPPKIQHRPGKTDLSANIARGLQTLDQAFLSKVLWQDHSLIEPYVNLSVLREAHDRLLKDGRYRSEILMLWRAGILSSWLHQNQLT